MAKVRPKVATSTTATTGPFTRPAAVWVAMDAPNIMTDDAAAAAAFDAWMPPNSGPSRLRLAGLDPTVAARHKVTHLRKLAAPRVLWMAGKLAPDEAAQIARWALWPKRAHRTMTHAAPDWLRGPPPWESLE